jgi:7-carboxy-7-deazaguanine synthase
MALRVNEIFLSLQGETTASGFPSLFIRMTGCNLRCSFCDTEYAWDEGQFMTVDEITEQACQYEWVHHITLTGGEPLAQAETAALADRLLKKGFRVRVETNGSLPIDVLPKGCERIVDIKPPSSGEGSSFYEPNLSALTGCDEVKFVVSTDEDFEFAARFCEEKLPASDAAINISPVFGSMEGERLASLILSRKLRVRLNLQLHKILWPKGEPRGSGN